jgi:hypothetical protein
MTDIVWREMERSGAGSPCFRLTQPLRSGREGRDGAIEDRTIDNMIEPRNDPAIVSQALRTHQQVDELGARECGVHSVCRHVGDQRALFGNIAFSFGDLPVGHCEM